MKKKTDALILWVTIYFLTITLNNILVAQSKKSNQYDRNYTIAYMRNVFYDLDLNDVQAVLRAWTNNMTKVYKPSIEFSLNPKIYNDLKELDESIQKDNVIAVSLSTYDYLTCGNLPDLEPAFVPTVENRTGIEFYFLVRKSDHYRKLNDLKGKKIGLISTPIYIASSLWLDVLLAKDNLPSKSIFFEKIEKAQKESQILLNLFFNNLDACIVSKLTYNLMNELNPQIGEKLDILTVSPSYIPGFLCMLKPNRDEAFRKEFYKVSTILNKNTFGKQMLDLLKIEGLVPFKDEYLTNYKKLISDHKRLSLDSKANVQKKISK